MVAGFAARGLAPHLRDARCLRDSTLSLDGEGAFAAMPLDDPYWRACADHVAALGLPRDAVLAPSGFEALLPGCRTPQTAHLAAPPRALVLHKGRLDEVPSAILLAALDNLAPSFANEVFMVLAEGGGDLPEPERRHVFGREALLVAALAAHERKAAVPARAASPRMAATYVGQGRVLLETIFGHLMLVDGGDTAIVPHLIRDGYFDRSLTNVIGMLLAPGMSFIDIGANCGTYTVIGADKVGPQGRVIAIEASPRLAGLLHETVAMNGFAERCEVLRCAAGAETGMVVLHEFANRKGNSTLLPHIAETAREHHGEAVTSVEVPCRPLDAIIAERSVERIDLVKIDVEGFEREVLLGARETLARFRPKLIVEWHNAFFDGRPGAARALYDLLTDQLGYRLHRIEQGATWRPVTFEDLSHGHSDLLCEPLA
jgi:FkbM family methyltransferase